MMKKTNTDPSMEESALAAAMKTRFTALSISSMHMKTTITFLLMMAPMAPIVNSMPLRMKHKPEGIS